MALLFIAGVIVGFQNLGIPDEMAWRYAMIVPAGLLLTVGIPMIFFSDDCPQGKWKNRLYNKASPDSKNESTCQKIKNLFTKNEQGEISPVVDWRVWVMAAQYACCFGVELSINNSMSSYFYRYFNTDKEGCEELQNSNNFPPDCSQISFNTANMIASLFGLTNLFARAIGGGLSDFAYNRFGIRGRLLVLFLCVVTEGLFLLMFCFMHDLGPAIVLLICFSISVQASEGATYGIVPSVSTNVGVVAGIVGAGGNIGAVLWQAMFR